MSTAQILEIYKVLQKYFQNEEDANRVVADLQKIIDYKFEERKTELSTKQDLNDLKLDVVSRIETSKADTIKWMFIFGLDNWRLRRVFYLPS
jgi:hypothetical protein